MPCRRNVSGDSVSRAKGRQGIPGGSATGQLGAFLGSEDLLPAVMALERRQVRRAREPLRLVVEAHLARRGREQLDERTCERGKAPDALGEEVGDVGVVAAEELVSAFAGERDLDVLGSQIRDEVR